MKRKNAFVDATQACFWSSATIVSRFAGDWFRSWQMIAPLAVAVAVAGFVAQAGAAPMKVFILAGQSNMVGLGGSVSQLTADQSQTRDNVLIYYNNVVSTSPLGWQPMSPATPPPTGTEQTGSCFGPEVSFGPAMAQYLGETIGIIKLSEGGTNLANDWSPGNKTGLYALLKKEVAAAQADRSITIAGMIWMQGERDSKFSDMAAAYQMNLTTFITTARTDFGAPDMPFVAGRINPPVSDYPYVATVRSAQEAITLPDYSWINTDDLQKIDGTPLTGVHYNTQGQLILGQRFADALIAIPEPSSLSLLGLGAMGLLARCCRRTA